ncbi:MAG: MGMT family protein, partial [Flavobacteriaceae bacterium]
HQDPSIPAQRVVNRSGLLKGKHHFPGSQLMQQLLENEGVEVSNDQVQHFKEILWDPSEHLPPWENPL